MPRCGPNRHAEMYENVHLGVRGGREVVDLVHDDALCARCVIDMVTKDSETDFVGPLVHGRPGERFVYKSRGHRRAMTRVLAVPGGQDRPVGPRPDADPPGRPIGRPAVCAGREVVGRDVVRRVIHE